MTEEPKIIELLDRINSLYIDFVNTLKYIKDYNSKYDMGGSYSRSEVRLDRSGSYKKLIELLIAKKFDEANQFVINLSEKLFKLHKFTLSEIAHKKLKDIGFQVENPFYFGKFRKEYKKLTAELDKLDEETLTNNDVTSIKLSFENVIERLRNLEYEIADERRSGLYNFVWKSFYFGMPVLIGLYQLIAMQYLTLNPYLPIGVYIIIVFVIYLLPKSITNLKYLYISLKTDSSNRYFLILMLLAPLVLILVSWFKPEPRDTQVIIPLSIISLISIYFFARSAVRDSKEALVREEIESLAEKYNLETKDASE